MGFDHFLDRILRVSSSIKWVALSGEVSSLANLGATLCRPALDLTLGSVKFLAAYLARKEPPGLAFVPSHLSLH